MMSSLSFVDENEQFELWGEQSGIWWSGIWWSGIWWVSSRVYGGGP